jgi:transcriptional regulator with XRE-family HTH domain
MAEEEGRSFGEQVRGRRLAAHLTQEELTERASAKTR